MSTPSTMAYDQYMVDIVEYFYTPQAFSDYALLRTRLVILDSLGCAIETVSQSAQCRAMLGPIVPGTVVPNGCRIPGTDYTLDPMKAAFDLGTMIRYLDHNDGYTGQEWGHPSDMLGAILSVADWQSRSGLRPDPKVQRFAAHLQPSPGQAVTIAQLLEATIKAFEVHCLFQHSNSFNKRGLDHTILVKVGAVVAVSWLLGGDRGQCLAALSQAYQDGGMLRTYRQAPNTGPRKGWAAGDACMRAVHLAFLTMRGQPGAPTVLTNPKWGFYATMFGNQEFKLHDRYGSYAVENNGFKLVAAEGHGISACNAALTLSQQLSAANLTTHAISCISIRTMKPAVTIIDKKGPLHNYADRDHCLSYMVAVTLLKGALPQVHDYADTSSFASSSEIERLRDVTATYEDEQLTKDYFDPMKRTLAAGLTITLTGGQKLDEVLVEAPLGHAKHPDTNAAVLVKFRENLAPTYAPGVADHAIAVLQRDELVVSDLMDLF